MKDNNSLALGHSKEYYNVTWKKKMLHNNMFRKWYEQFGVVFNHENDFLYWYQHQLFVLHFFLFFFYWVYWSKCGNLSEQTRKYQSRGAVYPQFWNSHICLLGRYLFIGLTKTKRKTYKTKPRIIILFFFLFFF